MAQTPPVPPVRLGLIGTGLAVEQSHWPALRRLTDRFEVTAFADSSPEAGARFAAYSGIDPIRMLCGEVDRVHGAVQWANSTIDAPSDLTVNLTFAGGTIGNYTAA